MAGDTATTLSPVPGWVPYPWSVELGTNEMKLWLEAIRAFTNVDSEDIVWIPGNHDPLAFEDEAETYRRMYPGMPVRQRLDIAGVRFLLINCGNYGGRNPEQMAWLREQLTQTPLDQPLVVVNHVPPFHIPVWYRGTALELRELFGDRPARWWTMVGHSHARSLRVFQIGRSTVASLVVGTSNPLNTNGASDDTGFAVLCLSNGVHAVIYSSFNRGRYELAPGPDWENPEPFLAPFEEVPGRLWRRLKSRGDPSEVECFRGSDSVEWYAYSRELRLRVPLGRCGGIATRFLLWMMLPSQDAMVEFEVEPGRWAVQPLVRWTNFVYAVEIPESLRGLPELRVRYRSKIGGNDFIAGWGLAATSGTPGVRFPVFRAPIEPSVAAGETLAMDLRPYVDHPFAPYDELQFGLVSSPEGSSLDPRTGL